MHRGTVVRPICLPSKFASTRISPKVHATDLVISGYGCQYNKQYKNNRMISCDTKSDELRHGFVKYISNEKALKEYHMFQKIADDSQVCAIDGLNLSVFFRRVHSRRQF